MHCFTRLLAILSWLALSAAHTQIVYPGERGDNLHTNGTLPQNNPNTIGVDISPDGSWEFPYGQQFIYPCGGMPQSRNRTVWPYLGGAISIQPGWFAGHKTAFFYINMGINAPGELAPPNMSHILVPPFQILGPSDSTYGGQFCLPQVPTPVNVTLAPGDNVTLQVIELTQFGASLYNCVDVTLVEPEQAIPVTPQNCFNSSDIGFELVFTSAALTSGAELRIPTPSVLSLSLVTFAALVMAVI